ncbi:MAG: hypothetical protein JO013_09740 [Alphaproteobacteria bacterium]|nr:hypothetical protein [Alphaproteobacteria bacterium]
MSSYYGPDPEIVDRLGRSVILLRDRLIRAGEPHVAERLGDIESRLRRGEMSAIRSLVSETNGGMGSLDDLAILRADIDALRALAQLAYNSAWNTQSS